VTYPAEIQDDTGKVIWGGKIVYTDQVNQPVPADGNVGFYGTTPISKPVIENATAQDLLTALSALGLVLDDTLAPTTRSRSMM
jgi:hypothetical protein